MVWVLQSLTSGQSFFKSGLFCIFRPFLTFGDIYVQAQNEKNKLFICLSLRNFESSAIKVWAKKC